jgi:hypothetical protein
LTPVLRAFGRIARVERVTDPGECFPLGVAVLVRVDLQRDRQPGVAKNELSVASRDLEVLEQGRRCYRR